MRSKKALRVMLTTALLAGCSAPVNHDEPDAGSGVQDGGIDWNLSENDGDLDSSDEQDALGLLTTCGEPGDYVHTEDLSLLEGCERSFFQIIIRGDLALGLPPLRSLVRSEDLLHVIRGYNLTDLTDLSRLEFVGGSLMIRFMPELTTLRGLESLRTIKENLSLTGLGVSELSPLSSLTSVGGLYIDLLHLNSMEGLDSLERVDGDVNISADGVSREELERFLDGVEVTGSIRLNGQDL